MSLQAQDNPASAVSSLTIMDGPREQHQGRQAAGQRLVQSILQDEALVNMIGEAAIEQAVADGKVVRISALTIGLLELVPAGKVAALEAAIDEALERLDEKRWADAIATLEATIPDDQIQAGPPAEPVPEPEPELGPEPGVDPAPAPPAAPEPQAKRRRPRPVEEPDEPADKLGRPKGFPEFDKDYECDAPDADGDPCGALITGKQAQMSMIRYRRKLCETCLAGWDPIRECVGAAPPEPDQPPEQPEPQT